MRNTIKNTSILLLILSLFLACENDIESIQVQKKPEKTSEYYENLKAYKKTDHQLAVGWFYQWSAQGVGRAGYLSSVPDSVDIILIGWREWENLTQAQIDDMRFVQQKYGTKVCVSELIRNIDDLEDPEGKSWGWIDGDDEAIELATRRVANAFCDSVFKYDFDGFDLDYEPNMGGAGNLSSYPERMLIFVKEMGKRLGNQSDSDKMFILDGEPMHLRVAEESYPYFDIFISQAYYTSGPASLQNRYESARKAGFKPNQFLVVEDFESALWQTGGVPTYKDPILGTMPSLLGMAHWNPTQGRKGGMGAFRMESEYNNPQQDYKYLRMAIQIMNPAVY